MSDTHAVYLDHAIHWPIQFDDQKWRASNRDRANEENCDDGRINEREEAEGNEQNGEPED